MFSFTPLLGAQTTSPASQSLLEFEGGIKVLIDVGWDATFEITKLEALEKQVPTLSLILLTHATPSHIAAFAHCCKHIPLFAQVPIYATQPVIYLGRTLLHDVYDSNPLASAVIPSSSLIEVGEGADDLKILFQPPTKEEIISYFQLIHPLKYSQPHEPLASPFSPPLNGLTITAYNAGHSLGGTIWHITHGMESVVYAVDWNQVRENVYNRAAWLTGGGGAEIIEQLQKPTALICSTKGVEKSPVAGGRSRRDELLLEGIRSALNRGGTVLVPTDACARILELAYVVEHAWRQQAKLPGEHPFKNSKVYIASRTINATIRYAKSMLEWMDDGMVREAEADPAAGMPTTKFDSNSGNRPDGGSQFSRNSARNGPFDFKYIKSIEKKSQLERVLSRPGPKVIIASDTTLEWGYSKEIFVRIAGDSNNLVILTDNHPIQAATSPDSLHIGSTLWQWYQSREGVVQDGQALQQLALDGRELEYRNAARGALEGHELGLYQQYLATQRQAQDAAGVGDGVSLEASADVINETASTSSSESEESDSDRQGRALNYSNVINQTNRNKIPGKEVIGANALLSQSSTYDYDVRGKKGRESLFPYVAKRKRADDFGEIIRPEDYLRAEERDEVDGRNPGGMNQKEQELGQKRKWGELEVVDQNGQPHSRSSNREKSNFSNGAATSEENGISSGSSTEDEDEESSIGPSKLIFTSHSLMVHARLAFVDFSGLHDQRNMSLLIPLIKPRKIVLTGGSESETQYLANECRQTLLNAQNSTPATGSGSDPLMPHNGETVEASMDTNAWTVRLSEALVRKIHWQSVGGRDVVTITGSLGPTGGLDSTEADASRIKRQKRLKTETEAASEPPETDDTNEDHKATRVTDLLPTLDVLPRSLASATRTVAQPLHVGDLKLADLRKMLLSEGFTAEFRGQGTLVVDGRVAVRKSAGGRLEVESGEGLGEKQDLSRRREIPFFAVKKRIYEGLAVIAGR